MRKQRHTLMLIHAKTIILKRDEGEEFVLCGCISTWNLARWLLQPLPIPPFKSPCCIT
jgi:hypothetical protein